MGDVATVVHPLEGDLGEGFIGFLLGGLKGGGGCCGGDDSAAGCEELA